jgi:ubiquinol-cytochrome c reductase cytochrome b subunit
LFVLPWLDTSKVRSMRYRPSAKLYFCIFVLVAMGLGFCGAHEPDEKLIGGNFGFQLLDYNINSYVWLSRLLTTYYFAYFLVITPLLGLTETPLPVPDSISTPVLTAAAALPKGATAQAEKKG